MRLHFLCVALCIASLAGCRPDYAKLPTFSAEHKLLQVVVEMPAGTNHIQRYDPVTRTFRHVQRAGTDRLIEFLPCPGNFGFIPGTRTVPTPQYPAGQPLDVLLLAETQPAGTVQEVVPVGMLLLDEAGTPRSVLLAAPARPSQQILPGATTWASLQRAYPTVRPVLEHWFRQWNGASGDVRIAGWKDEQYAQQQVRAAMQ